MGRHNKRPTNDGDIISQEHVEERHISEVAVERIGLDNKICRDCNANNSPNATSCRKCGGNVRDRKSRFADG